MMKDTINAQRSFDTVAEMQKEKLKVIETAGGTLKKIAEELCHIAFSNIKDYIEIAEGGEVQALPFDKIKNGKSKAVKKIKEHTRITEAEDGSRLYKDSTLEYELYDKVSALKELAKLRGDYPAEKRDIIGTITVLRPGSITKPLESGLSEDER